MPNFWKFDASPPRRRSTHLDEALRLGEGPSAYANPKPQNFPVSALPRQRLLRLGVGPRLGESLLRLCEPAVLFLFPFLF